MSTATDRFSHLVQVEVGGIQSFIFEGKRLREWRGASALLDHVGRFVLPAVLEEQYGAGARVLRRGGSVLLVGIPDDGPDPEAVERLLKRRFRAEVPSVQVYGATVAFEGGSVQEALAQLSFTAALRQGQTPQAASAADLLGAMMRPCDSCGRRPGQVPSPIADDGDLLCRACAAKGEYGIQVRRGKAPESVLDRFQRYLERTAELAHRVTPEDLTEERLPKDLADLAARSELGAVALILADGNAMGQTIQQITSLARYEAFSSGIATAVEEAVFDALAQHPPRPKVASGSQGGGRRLPWEIIFLGGDDVLIMTAADIALEVTQAMIEAVEAKSAAALDGLSRDFLSMGAGIVVADPHVPMATLRGLAGELERSAKALAYDAPEEVSTVDFHRITGSGSASLRHIRSYALRPRRLLPGDPPGEGAPPALDVSLTARPFTIDRLRQVRHVAQAWDAADLPSSKLQALRAELFTSPAEATRAWVHTVARAPKRRRPAWHRLHDLTPSSAGNGTDVLPDTGLALGLPWVASSGDGAPGDGPSGAAEGAVTTYLLDVLDVLALDSARPE